MVLYRVRGDKYLSGVEHSLEVIDYNIHPICDHLMKTVAKCLRCWDKVCVQQQFLIMFSEVKKIKGTIEHLFFYWVFWRLVVFEHGIGILRVQKCHEWNQSFLCHHPAPVPQTNKIFARLQARTGARTSRLLHSQGLFIADIYNRHL